MATGRSNEIAKGLINCLEGNLTMTIAATPQPPYYAVIFTSLRQGGDQGYAELARLMLELARDQPGFLGIE